MGVRYSTTQVRFTAGGSRIAGELHLPESGQPYACVVFAHGFSGTMDWILPDFARVFATAGLAVLTFDYRHFGLSEGDPRQLVDTRRQLEDIRAAVDFVRGHEAVDAEQIALWGTSLGGGHVLRIAADDPRVAAVVANVPGIDMYAGLRGRAKSPTFRPEPARTAIATAHLVIAALLDEIRGRLGRPPHYVPVFGRFGSAIFADPALTERFRDLEAHSRTWRNSVTPRFLFHAPRYRSGTFERIRCPVLVTLARDDAQISSAFVKRNIGQSRNTEIKEYPVGHFDVYHGAVRDRVAHDHCDFLIRHLSHP